MEEKDHEQIICRLKKLAKGRTSRKRFSLFMYLASCFSGLVLYVILSVEKVRGHNVSAVPLIIIAGMVALFGSAFAARSANSEISLILSKIIGSSDSSLISPLLQILDDLAGQPHQKALDIITSLLPSVHKDNEFLLSADDKVKLYRILIIAADPASKGLLDDIALQIVELAERLADIKSISHLKSITHMKTSTETQMNLRDAAERCIVTIQAKTKEQRLKQTLLRVPSDPITQSSDALLRPVSSTSTDTPKEQLILPASEPD